MLNNVTFGQHYPVESFVHKMDARAKILLTILYIVIIFFVESYFGYVLTAGLVLGTILASKVPLKTVLKSIKAILFIVILTAVLNLFLYNEGKLIVDWWIFTITDEAVHFAVKMSLRLLLLIMGTTILTLTTTPMDLTDAIEKLLSPLKVIKFPVADVAIVMSIALRFIPTLMEETDKIIMAQKSRGADFESGSIISRAKAMLPILIPLFVSSFRRADELALALDSRCYKATENKTKMKQLKYSYRDLIALLVVTLYVTLVMLDKYLWLGLF